MRMLLFAGVLGLVAPACTSTQPLTNAPSQVTSAPSSPGLIVSPNPVAVNAATTFTLSAPGATHVKCDFADGAQVEFGAASGTIFTHVFNRLGTFCVTCTETDAQGNTVSASACVVVR
jgi:hypothetical protein